MNIPTDLIDQIARGNCVLFLGSGPSMAAGLPSWSQLLHDMIDWLQKQEVRFSDKLAIEALIAKGDFLLAAEELLERLGEDNFRGFMGKTFDRADLEPNSVHLLAAQIPFAAQVTTNYDTLSEKAYERIHKRAPVVFTQADVSDLARALRSDKYYILKSHGSIERVDTVVLTRRQYRAVMHANPAARKFLETLFSTKTVLFVGFGLNDPDLFLTLNELQAAFHGHTGTHYALIDETRLSEIERARFLKDYKIEILPYTRSADDHPEVREFLEKLHRTIPKVALHHRLNQANQLLGDFDTHYKLVANTENEYVLKEKFPGAAAQKPLAFSVELRFDKKTQEGQDALAAWQKHRETGEPITIKTPHVYQFLPPEIISRFMPSPTIEMELTIGPVRSETKIPIRMIVETENGATYSVDNIVLEVVRRGEKEITLSNEAQGDPWKVGVVLRDDSNEFQFSFTGLGINVKRALDGYRFLQALSTDSTLTVELQETGQTLAPTAIPAGRYPSPDARLIDLLEALTFIQKKLPVTFESPNKISFEQAKDIFVVSQILKSGIVELQPETMIVDMPVEQLGDLVQRFERDTTVRLNTYFEDISFTILGKPLSLGPMATTREVCISPNELDELKKAAENAVSNQLISVNLSAVQGKSPLAQFPDWLPKDEAARIRQLPFVRAATLKSLLFLLFGAAKTREGFDPGEFMELLEYARDEVFEDGQPVNALSSCTTDEFAAVLRQVLPELDTNSSRLLKN